MEPRLPVDGRAVGLMMLLCATWALQQVSLKTVAAEASPMLMIGLRSGLAALAVAALMRHRGERVTRASGRWRPGLLAAALFALEFLLIAEALRRTHAAHVVVFLYTAPIFAALGLHARLPAERLAPAQWAGIAVSFAGIAVAFVGRAQASAAPDAVQVLLGDALALAAGAVWGATTVAVRCSVLSSAPPAETLLYQLAGAFVVLVPAAAWLGQAHFEPGWRVFGHLAFQAIGVSFASFLVWFWLLRRYLASQLGVFSFLTPVFGVVLGAWLLGEPIDPAFLAGGVLVLAGIGAVTGAGPARKGAASAHRGQEERARRCG